MILTVTLNAALDVTYRVDALRPHTTHRVRDVHAVAGGKGVNVARVLAAHGEDVVATGLVGGVTGRRVRDDLAGAAAAGQGPADAMVEIAGESRRTLTVHAVGDGDATVFNEAGPVVAPEEWSRFRDRFAALLVDAEAVALCGSLPPGLPEDAYATLVRMAEQHGVPAVVDTSGRALTAAVDAGPRLVTPNAAELAEVAGVDDPFAGAARLRDAGARTVVATLGADGLLALTEDGCLHARPPAPVAGNPTGAGDACTAALVRGLASGEDWPDVLRRAVAWSAAAVAMPRAGEVDVDVAARLQHTATVEVADAPGAHR